MHHPVTSRPDQRARSAPAVLSRILIYPVKSLDELDVSQVTILASGALENDRVFALFDADGNYVNGKRCAEVHRLRLRVDPAERTLSLRDEGGRGLGERSFRIDAEREGLERWLYRYFGFSVELRENIEGGFPDDTDLPGPTVISFATLVEIGCWFGLPVEQVRRRFRTNLEISTVPAFWEDRLFGAQGSTVRFRVGDAIFEGINPCQRCAVPPRDPETGKNDPTFVRRFTEFRRESLPRWSTRERFNHFYRVAINTRAQGNQAGKTIRVGDPIEILEVSTIPTVGAGTPPG